MFAFFLLLSFITSDAFLTLADHTYESLHPESVQEGELLFVKTHDLPDFFTHSHPRILHPYKLLTHITDESAPAQFAPLLADPKLLVWFALNYDGFPHSKIIPIPIGVAPASLPHGDLSLLQKIAREKPPKQHLLFLNFTIQTYSQERFEVFKQFALAPYCYRTGKKPFEAYLRDMASSKFTLAPRGAGLDTYRLWEALYVGSIPIVKTSSLDPLYKGLPVLIIDDWSEVTQVFLEAKYEEFASQQFSLEKLDFSYWSDQIKNFF